MSGSAIFVACSALPEGDGDEHAVPEALADLGFKTQWAAWDDTTVDFGAADIVILRATWDYAERRDEFLSWTESVPALANAAEVVRWNADKSYLAELGDAGVAVVPTTLIAPDEKAPRWPKGEFVLKPAIGAGSRGVGRFTAGDAAAAHLAGLQADGNTVLLQPYQSRVDSDGEIALVYFGGVYSHAFSKAAMLGRELDESGLYVTEELAPVQPEGRFGRHCRALAEDALDAAAALLGILRAELLYARVDLVAGPDGSPLLLELELVEPSLGFRQTEASAAWRFASAVRQQLA
ncbi:RimK family alpha-L-glutamate ligase [Amycolatopsis sp. NPDC102389]|uniref:ATP-grasp domain-containing protein n=1 Tax=Amycolatopsis sp. NPDC102389 TaxID=3363941 RepID=UPI0037F7EABF